MSKQLEIKRTDLIARQPKQARGRVKVERILAAAEELILEHGADGFSSPMVAEIADIPVASVYQFFPTRYAILRTLAERYVDAWNEAVIESMAQSNAETWQDAVRSAIDGSVDYANKNPVILALFLRSSVRSDATDVTDYTGGKLAKYVGNAIAFSGDPVKTPEGMEPARVAINLSQAVFATGFRAEGKISDYAKEEAKRIVIAYLEMHAPS